MVRARGALHLSLTRDRGATLRWHHKILRTRNSNTHCSSRCLSMKTTNLVSVISTALVALSQPAWAGGRGGGGVAGGGGFRGGGVGGGFHSAGVGGGFRGGALATQPV